MKYFPLVVRPLTTNQLTISNISCCFMDQSNTSVFAIIRSGLDDFGIVMYPCCTHHLIRTCAGDLLYLKFNFDIYIDHFLSFGICVHLVGTLTPLNLSFGTLTVICL